MPSSAKDAFFTVFKLQAKQLSTQVVYQDFQILTFSAMGQRQSIIKNCLMGSRNLCLLLSQYFKNIWDLKNVWYVLVLFHHSLH